jgi:hypothetical protein
LAPATTQPTAVRWTDADAMVPATQPMEGTATASIDDEMGGGLPAPAPAPSDEDLTIAPAPETEPMSPTTSPASQPSTQPATQPSSSLDNPSNVTELPMEPVNSSNNGGSWSGDGNK